MKRPDHEKSLLGRVPTGTLASSSERFTKSLARQLHTGLDQQTARFGPGVEAQRAPNILLHAEWWGL
ncbi:MAG: hypothetical protein KTR25_15815 [Myxococcales bacterium]|nr:hypothetical protein [Myxococcales bacterium]